MKTSLRLLFSVGFLLACVPLGNAAEPASPQEAVATAITEFGGIVERDNARAGRPVIGVILNFGRKGIRGVNRNLEATELDCLAKLTDLQRLDVADGDFGSCDPRTDCGTHEAKSAELTFCGSDRRWSA